MHKMDNIVFWKSTIYSQKRILQKLPIPPIRHHVGQNVNDRVVDQRLTFKLRALDGRHPVIDLVENEVAETRDAH